MPYHLSNLCSKVVGGQMNRRNIIDASTAKLEGQLTGTAGEPSNGLIMHRSWLAA